MFSGERSDLITFDEADLVRVGDPDATLKVFGDAVGSFVEDSIGLAEGSKGLLANADNRAAFHTHPDLSRMVQGHGVDLSAREVRDVAKWELDELFTIEADDAAVGANPKVSFRGLRDGRDAVVGESVFGLPGSIKPFRRTLLFP